MQTLWYISNPSPHSSLMWSNLIARWWPYWRSRFVARTHSGTWTNLQCELFILGFMCCANASFAKFLSKPPVYLYTSNYFSLLVVGVTLYGSYLENSWLSFDGKSQVMVKISKPSPSTESVRGIRVRMSALMFISRGNLFVRAPW